MLTVTSADKLGMVVAVAAVVIFVGLGVGMSNVSEDNTRPDIDQQRAVPITEDLMKPKVTVDPGAVIDTGDYGTGSSETCSADPPPPPGPGVNWDYCDISENDYSGEDLSDDSVSNAPVTQSAAAQDEKSDIELSDVTIKNPEGVEETVSSDHVKDVAQKFVGLLRLCKTSDSVMKFWKQNMEEGYVVNTITKADEKLLEKCREKFKARRDTLLNEEKSNG